MNLKQFLRITVTSLCIMVSTCADATEMSAQEIAVAIKENKLTIKDTVDFDGASYALVEFSAESNSNPEALATPALDSTKEYYKVQFKLEKPALWAGIEISTDIVEIRVEEGIEPLSPLYTVKNEHAVNDVKHVVDISRWKRNNDTYYNLQEVGRCLDLTATGITIGSIVTLAMIYISHNIR